MPLVIDADTHVDPSVDVLQQYADSSLAERWEELGKFTVETPAENDETRTRTVMRVRPMGYSRLPGEPLSDENNGFADRPNFGAGGKAQPTKRGVGKIPQPVLDLDSRRRLQDMDAEGVNQHLIIPGVWPASCTAIDPLLATGLYEAHHRYIAEYCSVDTERLKSVVLAPAFDPVLAAKWIHEHAGEAWCAGALLILPQGLPVDDPRLNPIWDALNETNMPLMFHPFTYEPPYFPGYKDIWGNIAVARSAALPWAAQRLIAYMIVAGFFDTWPNLRVGFGETSAGWLPAWLQRLEMNVQYLPHAVRPTAMLPTEYARAGHIYCTVELYEGPETIRHVTEVLGSGVLMYSSDYPHAECEWPDSVTVAESWRAEVGDEVMDRFFYKNAQQYLSGREAR